MINHLEHNRKGSNHLKTEEPVTLLWTGGWDSTFRLIQIILLNKRKVQPYYIIDPNRKSVRYEMRAMQIIKKDILHKFPDAYNKIKPTIYIELDSINNNKNITNAYKKVCENYPIGIQYDWLSRFSQQYGIVNLELTIEKGIGSMNILLKGILNFKNKTKYSGYRLKANLEDKNAGLLFKNFCFPIIDIYKYDMIRIAKQNNFFHILEKTWFCHNPLNSGIPCGTCVPCTQVVKEGMSFRLPFYSKIRYRLRILLSKDQLKQSFPKCYNVIKYIKRLIK